MVVNMANDHFYLDTPHRQVSGALMSLLETSPATQTSDSPGKQRSMSGTEEGSQLPEAIQ